FFIIIRAAVERMETMATVKLYDDAPYEREFRARIEDLIIKENCVGLVLDRTLFFPKEGGQSPDKGTIGGYEVRHVYIDNEIIVHETDCPADAFKRGDEVKGCINWDHRFSNMQNHSGEHILSGILHSDYSSENVGFHLSDNIVTLDTSKVLSPEQIRALEKKANEVVYADLLVDCRYYEKEELDNIDYRSKLSFEGPARLVVIPGVDICACCAPHVKHTGQIGLIKIVKYINYKGGMRLTILCGRRAYDYACRQQDIIEELMHRLSVAQDKLPEAVERLMEKVEDMKLEKVERTGRELFEKVAELDRVEGNAIIFVEEVNSITQRRAVNELSSKHSGICGVFSGNDEDGYRFIIAVSDGDSRDTADLLKDRLGAKCGGSKEMVQGSVCATKEGILKVLEEGYNMR
ncbi:MAG: hypothetical protein K6B28_09190, partial [Lachnospiraceae bacterium]|nr:hypothetical protein [Lachnospiraceae bacterium]